MAGPGAPAGAYGPVPSLGADSTRSMAVCLLSDLSRRVKGRQECSWLEGSLFDLDSDVPKHSCRPGPTGAFTFQQETSA